MIIEEYETLIAPTYIKNPAVIKARIPATFTPLEVKLSAEFVPLGLEVPVLVDDPSVDVDMDVDADAEDWSLSFPSIPPCILAGILLPVVLPAAVLNAERVFAPLLLMQVQVSTSWSCVEVTESPTRG